ncbi:MAG TPA: hypothetical protein VMU50_01320, partial [Polyangia bacterium]|nr:hypothetical protein [Polyangia bacterium]
MIISRTRGGRPAVGLLLALLMASGASGQTRADAFDDDVRTPVHVETWQATAGLRTTLIRDRG